ncbi:MAG: porin [Lentimicrobiaceae bacterium]|nr:porin [Lentimicrobiaceae bacterium]
MRRKSLLFVMIMLLFGLSSLNAQESKKSLIGDYLSIGGWMNIQYDYEQQMNGEEVVVDMNTFNVRRARLDIKGNINPYLEFRLQSDFAVSPKMVDGFVKIKLAKYFNIQAGQFKIPFTFENPQSPLTLEGIEYAQVISKLSGYSDVCHVATYSGGRDVGLMLYGNFFSFENNGKDIPILTYKLGVFNGNGMNKKDANTKKDIAASIEICPGVKGLMLAASYYDGNYMLDEIEVYNDDAERDRFTVGAKYEGKSLVVRSEYITGKTGMNINGRYGILNSDGLYVAAGYWFNYTCKNTGKTHKIRPVARYDFFREDVEDINTNSTYYMVGVDWWPMHNLRLLLNYTLKDKVKYNEFGHLLQAQLSVKF